MENNFLKRIQNSIKHWYLLLILGLVFIATGIWTLASPLESYEALSIVFTISFIISGILEIAFALSNRKEYDHWGWNLVFGILSLIVGIMLINNPLVSMITLPLYVGFLIMFRSFGAIGFSLDLKNYRVMEWGTLMALGILGLLFSIMLLWNPVFAGITIVVWTGLAFIASGVFNIYISLKLKKLKRD